MFMLKKSINKNMRDEYCSIRNKLEIIIKYDFIAGLNIYKLQSYINS